MLTKSSASLRRKGSTPTSSKAESSRLRTHQHNCDRLKDYVEDEQSWGETDHVLLSAEESMARINVANTLGGAYSPHGARIHPAKLVRGLAEAVERAGVTIYEGTRVREILPRRAVSDRGEVNADYVLRATEGFTAALKGLQA